MSVLGEPAPTDHGRSIRLDLWSDLGCPWCYLGAARLSRAIESSGRAGRLNLVLRSFELDPDASTRSITIPEMLASKYGGSTADMMLAEDRIRGLAEAEGLAFSAERRHASTFDVHRVQHLAAEHGVGEAFYSALQRGYFAGTADPYDAEVLVSHAARAGVPADQVREVLAGDRFGAEVREDEELARRLGITGVPFLVLDERLAVAGAQGLEVYQRALAMALEEEPAG